MSKFRKGFSLFFSNCIPLEKLAWKAAVPCKPIYLFLPRAGMDPFPGIQSSYIIRSWFLSPGAEAQPLQWAEAGVCVWKTNQLLSP